MKLSPETLTILNNFASIHKGILFRPGNVLRTRTNAIYAEATVSEEFPAQVGIVDLGNLLSAISLFKTPDLVFEKNFLRIVETDENSQRAEILYGYAGEDMVALPMNKKSAFVVPSENVSFTLSEDEMSRLKKAVAVTEMPEIKIASDGSDVTIGTFYHKLPEAKQGKSYTMAVNGETNGIRCKQIFDVNNLKLLKGDYNCRITKLFTEFKHRNLNLTYAVGPEPSSTFEG